MSFIYSVNSGYCFSCVLRSSYDFYYFIIDTSWNILYSESRKKRAKIQPWTGVHLFSLKVPLSAVGAPYHIHLTLLFSSVP